MKIMFKNLVSAYTGRVDDIVIYYSKQAHRCIARRRPVRKATAENEKFRSIQENLYLLMPSQAYIADLKIYREQFCNTYKYRNRPLPNWINAFKMMFYEMQRRMPGQVDLAIITRTQIYDQNLPCISIARAVQFGLLPDIQGWENLTAEI